MLYSPESRSNKLDRKVVIDPAVVYIGETERVFTITFTAPGPMDGAVLSIAIPDGLQPNISNPSNPAEFDGCPYEWTIQILLRLYVRVRGAGGATRGAVTVPSLGTLNIVLTKITKDQTVVITYTREGPIDYCCC